MNGDKYSKPDKFATFAGILGLICGISMLFQGYSAFRSGAIIPRTGKHGPMSGLEFMIAGGMFSLFGLGLLLNEIVKACRVLTWQDCKESTFSFAILSILKMILITAAVISIPFLILYLFS
jgi:hypothetical protein